MSAADQGSTPGEAKSALWALDPGIPRDPWVKVLAAAKAAGLDFDTARAWSAQAGNFDEAGMRDTWRSLRATGGITARTLFGLAREAGWRGDPRPTARPQATTDRPQVRRAPAWPADVAWTECEPATEAHPYIARKAGSADGLRVYPTSAAPRIVAGEDVRGWLVVPARGHDGTLATLQLISPKPGGRKLNLPGHSVAGWFSLGELKPGATAFVCEGIGAAWAAHHAIGTAALVAFGAGNQRKVAEAVKRIGAHPVIVADRGKEQQCEQAARDIGCGWVAMPATMADNSDLDDIRKADGLGAVRTALEAVQRFPEDCPRNETRRRLQQDENGRLQDAEHDTAPPSMSVDEMLDDCVWIADGSQVGRISNPKWVLQFSSFCDLTASCAEIKLGDDGKKRRVLNATVWKQHAERKTVHTRTFHAGAQAICHDPDGLPALNSWRPIVRWTSTASVQPFTDQMAYLIGDTVERAAFFDWLAHIEQRPGVLPHYGWLHIAKNTGTGRNWLASVLARVWRGYVAPNVDLPALLESQFNGALAGRVLAMVDEVQEGGGENQFRHANRLKSIVNAEERGINPKFGRQFKEHNSCRWLVFSNHDNALPLNDTDRRWRVVRHDAAPRSAEDYASLYALLDDAEFINAVGVWLRQRDISAFNPGERPPMSEAKRAAIGASKTLIQQNAEELAKHWPADVVTNADAAAILGDGAEKGLTPAMRRVLEEVGAVSFPRTLKVNRQATRCWVLRDQARWLKSRPSDVVLEVSRARGHAYAYRTAAEVLADGAA